MGSQRETIVIEVDSRGVATAMSSSDRDIAKVEASVARFGKSVQENMLVKLANLEKIKINDPQAVKDIQRVRDKILADMQKTADGASQFGEKIRNAIQNPMQAAGDAIGGLVTKLGPLGVGLSVGAAAISMAAKSGWDFAKSLAVMGDQIEDTASRMGISIREEEAFRFAMERSSGGIGQLENIMRKLSQEIDAGGANLTKMGLRFRDVQTGELRPMSETILELSKRLGAMPEGPIRNAAAIKVMGRAALEVLPDLIELADGVKRAGELKIGWGPDDVKKAAEFRKEVADLTAQWDLAVLHFKQPIAASLIFTIKGIEKLDNLLAVTGAASKVAFGMGPKMFPNQGPTQSPEDARAALALENAAIARNDAAIRTRLQSTDEERLAAAKKKLAELGGDLSTGVMYKADRFKEFDAQKALVSQIEQRIEATKRLAENEKLLVELRDASDIKEIDSMKESEAWIDRIDKAKMNASQQDAAYRELARFSTAEYTKESKTLSDTWEKLALAAHKFASALMDKEIEGGLKKSQEFADSIVKSGEQRRGILVGAERGDIERQASHALQMVQAGGGVGRNSIEQAYSIRKQLASDLYDYEVKQAQSISDIGERSVAVTKAWADEKRMIDEAEMSRIEDISKLDKQRFEDLKRGFEGLFDAAFAGARSFWDALKRMAFTIFLTPVKEALAGTFANMFMGARAGGSAGGGFTSLSGGVATALAGFGGGGAALPGMMPGWQGSQSGGGGIGSLFGGAGMFSKAGLAAAAPQLALMGSGLGMMGAYKLGGMGTAGKIAGPAVGAVSGLLGFGALASMFPALIAAGPAGWIAAAGIGAFVGIVGALRKSATQKVREKVKALYQIDIQTKSVLEQIAALSQQNFGGNIDMAIRTQEVRNLIELYGMSTGQGRGGLPANMAPVSMVQMSGGLYQQSAKGITSLGATSGTGGGGTIVIPLTIDSKTIGTVIVQNGRVVADGALAAAKSNYRRVDGALASLSPSTIRG